MKTYILFIALILHLFVTKNIAQEKKEDAILCIKKDDIIIDGFYGLPYVAGSYAKSVFTTNTSGINNNIESVKNLNHVGGKFEYMITKDIGIGLEYTYASVNIKYLQENITVNSNGQNTSKIYHYKASLYKQRILGKVNFHFGTTKKFDPYGTLGFGYKVSKLKSNNPDDAQSVSAFNNTFSNLFPFALRFGIGIRYFFTQNIGLNIETGIGGPTIQAGVTLKF